MKMNLRERSGRVSTRRRWAIILAGIVAFGLGVLVVMVGLDTETNVELRPWVLAAGLFIVCGLYGVLNLPGSNLALRGACLLIFVACAAFTIVEWQAYFREPSSQGTAVPFPTKPSLVFLVVGLPCLVFACTGYIRGLNEEEDDIRDMKQKDRLTNG